MSVPRHVLLAWVTAIIASVSMLRYGQNYVEQGIHHYELKFRLERIKWLKKEAQSLDFQFGAT